MTTDPKALVDLGKLSKPATVLIEKVSEAVGGVFRPFQIKRVAKAEAEAELIRAEAQIQVTDLNRRAFQRWFNEEAKKQENIEDITRKALPHLGAGAKPEEIENDWIVHFFDKGRLVSDEDMQQLWSRVLAGEANKHGSFAKRTINALSSLDKADAELFTSFCTYCWMIGDLTPVVFDHAESFYKERDLTFASLLHLDSIGLIQFNPLGTFSKVFPPPGEFPRTFTLFYFGTPLQLLIPTENYALGVGKVFLTQTGAELAPITDSKADPEFFEYTRSHWKHLEPPLPTPPAPSAPPA